MKQPKITISIKYIIIFLLVVPTISFAQEKKEKKEFNDDMYGHSRVERKPMDTRSAVEQALRHYELDSINNKPVYIYAQLLGTGKFLSSKVSVEVDFGQETGYFNWKDSNRIVDPKTGKPVEFNSMVDAMNYMGALGWEFMQAYVVTVSSQNIYHWLLRKQVTDKDLTNDLPTTRRDINK